MSFNNTLPEFNYDDITWLKNDNIYGDNLGFDEQGWDMSNVAGPSQTYTGAEVFGDFNNYPDFPSPSTAPTSLNPTHGVSPIEGYYSPFYQGTATPPFHPQPTALPSPSTIHPAFAALSPILPTFAALSPIPSLSYGSHPISPELYGAPATPTYHPHPQAPTIHNPDDMGYDFLTGAGTSSLPTVHYPPAHEPSFQELGHQFHQSGPLYDDMPAFNPAMVAAPPEPLPAPVASSSGPKRTKKTVREGRRFDPLKPAGRTERLYNTLHSVHHGQPSGGFVPATALAAIDKLVKEDLERSPLQDTAAGKGTRSRDVEDYLKGLLGAIRREGSTPKPGAGGSDEDDTSVAALSTLAGELEADLMAVNQLPALRRMAVTSKPKQRKAGKRAEGQGEKRTTEGRAKKSEAEILRRGGERQHLERMCSLFKAPEKGWTKKQALSLVTLFRLYGPEAFPLGFVKVRSTTSGL